MVFNCEQYPPCAMTCRGGGGVRGGVFAGGGVGCATGSVMGSRIGSCTRSIMGSGMGSCTGSIMGSGMGSCTGSCVGNCMGNCVGCCMGSGVGSDMFPSGECNWLEGITSWVLAMVTACFHLIALLHHMAIVAWTLVCIEFNANDVFMGSVVSNSWRYLTGWNFVAQLTYLAIRCSSDLAGAVMYVFGQGNGGSCAKRGIDSTGNIMFQALIFPVSASVCALFWTLYHVEKELVFPGCLVDIVPKWWNHAMHSVPGGIAVLELFMTGGRHCWKRKRWIAICLLQFFLLCYDVCVLTTHMIDGVWLYPVYAVLPCWSMRILHLATIHLLALIFYYLGDQIGTYLYELKLELSGEVLPGDLDGTKESKPDTECEADSSPLTVLRGLINTLSAWILSSGWTPRTSEAVVCASHPLSCECGRNSPLEEDHLAKREQQRLLQRSNRLSIFAAFSQHERPRPSTANATGINAVRTLSVRKLKMRASTNRASATWVPDIEPPPSPGSRNER